MPRRFVDLTAPAALLLSLALGCQQTKDVGKGGTIAHGQSSANVDRQAPARTAAVASTAWQGSANGEAGSAAIAGTAPVASMRGGNQHDPSSPMRWPRRASAAGQTQLDGPRLYAKTRHVWIYAEPDASKQWIGYLWSGGSVRLRDPRPKYGLACDYFYAIEPRGYVCIDGGRATTDPNDPVVVALQPFAPQADSPFPHRYGESRGAPLYYGLPSESDQRGREPDLKRHLERVALARDTGERAPYLQGVDLTAAPEQELIFPKLSPSVREAHELLKNRSTVAYTTEVRHAGRDFLLTADYRFIPKDRVAPYPISSFAGLKLPDEAKLPLAFFRTAGVRRYRRDPDGSFVVTGEPYQRLSHVELTGNSERVGRTEYLETRAGDWLDRSTAAVPTPSPTTPWNERLGDPARNPLRPKGRATWIEVSIRGGWLLAFEGTTPVFATLISPGRGGEAVSGRDPLETSATPLGRFSITGKFVTSTMVAPNDYLHSDVPFAQNFTGPYALHAAYWHDNWGNLMSGGCINLSPADALFMFNWTEPTAPAGWHGTRWLPYLEPSTTLIVHR